MPEIQHSHDPHNDSGLKSEITIASLSCRLEQREREIERLQEELAIQREEFSKQLLHAETEAMNQRAELQCQIENMKLQARWSRSQASDSPPHAPTHLEECSTHHAITGKNNSGLHNSDRPNSTQHQQYGEIATVGRQIAPSPQVQNAPGNAPEAMRHDSRQILAIKEQIDYLQQAVGNINQLKSQILFLADSEARFTELHEHIMALHWKIEDQEQRLREQSQLFKQGEKTPGYITDNQVSGR